MAKTKKLTPGKKIEKTQAPTLRIKDPGGVIRLGFV